MAEFENKKLEKTNVNQGQEFKNGDGVRATDINALVSGVLYNTEKLQTMGNITIISEADYPNQDGSVTPFPNMSPSVFLAIYQELGKGNAVFYKPFGSEITPVLANPDNIQLLVKNVLYTYSIEGSEVTCTTEDLSKYYEKKANVNIDWNGVVVYHNTDGVVSGTKFEGKQITSTNYTTGETGVLQIPQNKNGTLALVEDVENKVDKDYVFVNEVVLEEDSKEIVLRTDSAGNNLSGYSELSVIFLGKFTTAFTEKPIYLRFNNGEIYQSYENATANDATKFYFKTWKTNKQYINYIDKYFYQCNYMQGLCKKTNMNFQWQGIQDQNTNMMYDSCMTTVNWTSIRFGSTLADVTIAAGSKLLVLGKK